MAPFGRGAGSGKTYLRDVWPAGERMASKRDFKPLQLGRVFDGGSDEMIRDSLGGFVRPEMGGDGNGAELRGALSGGPEVPPRRKFLETLFEVSRSRWCRS